MRDNLINEDIPNDILYNFLKIYCELENNYYVFDKLVYKKYEYNNFINEFLINKIKNKYKETKQNYLLRSMSYNNLMTIIRQLCKINNIKYYSKIK